MMTCHLGFAVLYVKFSLCVMNVKTTNKPTDCINTEIKLLKENSSSLGHDSLL